MINHWLTALLCLFLAFAATGCGTARNERKRAAGYTQTGTNIPRWTQDSSATRQTRSQRRTTKPKREKTTPRAEKPKREKRERSSRASDEDVVTRGGFR